MCESAVSQAHCASQGTTQPWSEDKSGSPGSSGHDSSYFSGEQLHSHDSPVGPQASPDAQHSH